MTTDIIDELAGVVPGTDLDGLRRHRDQARTNAQASYDALFTAADGTGASHIERLAVAAFVTALHRAPTVHAHYRDLLAASGGPELAGLVGRVAADAATVGPYGRFPSTADLRAEDAVGLVFRVDPTAAAMLGARVTAALEHAHLLVFRPREASPGALVSLQAAGWSTPAIVTLSQLVAFLSFQLRVVSGLRVLKESRP
ncbi:MAG TPA: CMD domain protein [Propionicimonas sp.]|jgi:CMD domain protein|uniref:CMD domain protein n=1 Tax=Propionicimonas sp. TaxID=1955623 RepID=UPI002F3FD6A0